jgi:hypothetical protein
MKASGRMEWGSASGHAHDDFVVSLALAVKAAGGVRPVAVRGITWAGDPLA